MQQPIQEDADNGDLAQPIINPTTEEVHACQFSSWYSSFRNIERPLDDVTSEQPGKRTKYRKNVTIESIIISPLPSDFIEYLLSDGVRLPDCATKVSSCMNDVDGMDDGWDSSNEDENSDASDDDQKRYAFPSLTEDIQSAINALGGEGNKGCMPKLNWSSPKDATWINCGSLKCTKAGDVYLLLKSSEFVGFDLERAWKDVEDENKPEDDALIQMEVLDMANLTMNASDESRLVGEKNISHTSQFELVLRKWCNLHPSMEFRCFIFDHELIALCQRHPTKFYPHLQSSANQVNPILPIIQTFFCKYVQKRFANGAVHRYVLDLYVDSQERTWIVDFNVWGSRTDAMLFDWKELMELVQDFSNTKQICNNLDTESPLRAPEFRVVTKDMKSMTYDPLSSFRGPTDAMDLLSCNSDSDGGFEGTSFENFMKQCVRPSEM